MNATPIEWCDLSVNPIRARHRATGAVGHHCVKVSRGCANCYASRLQPRFGMPSFVASRTSDVEPFLDDRALRAVVARKKPARIFWCDMTDLFGEWVPDAWIDACFGVMAWSSRHTHIVVTKRAERMLEYVTGLGRNYDRIADAAGERGLALRYEGIPIVPWPIPNVWLLVSAEDQGTADERIPLLLRTPAAVRGASLEPLLGSIDLLAVLAATNGRPGVAVPLGRPLIDWVIVGGESGPGARPMHPDWARSIRDQCQAAGVAFFFKQWGAWGMSYGATNGTRAAVAADSGAPVHLKEGERLRAFQTFGGAFATMSRVGKKRAGRELDGRTWDEFPG